MAERKRVEQRVRGVLLTPSGQLLLIKRVRDDVPPYWVFPGGGVEPEDESLEAALRREVREELGGDATIRKLVFVLERDKDPETVSRELFYLADIERWDESARSGPEFARADSGQYIYDEFPLQVAVIAERDIKPDALKDWLLAHHADLEAQPDLRER